jgi:hypothetical protein
MSRYRFTADKHTVIVGWDNPLETYFAQVWKGKPESAANVDPRFPELGPQPALWLGGERNQVMTVEELAEHLRPYATLPLPIEERLRRDLAQAVEPTPHQKYWAERTARPEHPDFLAQDHGTVWKFTPLTTQAKLFADELPLERWQWQGQGFVVDHRFGREFTQQLEQEGFRVARAPTPEPDCGPEPEF